MVCISANNDADASSLMMLMHTIVSEAQTISPFAYFAALYLKCKQTKSFYLNTVSWTGGAKPAV